MFDAIVLERGYAEHVADYIDLEDPETTCPDDPCDDDIPFGSSVRAHPVV